MGVPAPALPPRPPAALEDTAHYDAYCAQVRESKNLLYAALDRRGIKYWPSAANFVLVRFDSGLARIVAGLADRGVLVRDRSADRGCDGCIRVTTGLAEHTRAFIAALEEVMCAEG